MDINLELFKRTNPSKKIEIVNKLTDRELLNISYQTIVRIVKEVGYKVPKSRDKTLYIDRDRVAGNGWNSEMEKLYYYTKNKIPKIDMDFYVQYGSTDTNKIIPLDKFLCRGEFRGAIKYEDRYGNSQTSYFTYNDSDKAKVIKSICLDYIYTKYRDKL